MLAFLRKVLMIIGALSLISIISFTITLIVMWQGKDPVPETTFLEIDFEKGVAEYVSSDPAARMLADASLTVLDVVEALALAETDDRVVGLIARIGAAGMGFARLQEVRDAVNRFRAAGKPAIAYTDTFGAMSGGNIPYYLASFFDQIYMQPSGEVAITGFQFKGRFFKGSLEKLGIEPRMDHRKAFKTAMNRFTEKEFTDAHETSMRSLMTGLFDQMVGHIATSRELSEESVRRLFDKGVFSAQEALDAGLVDALAYRDEVYTRAENRFGEAAEPLGLSAYLARSDRLFREGEAIALIHGVGTIHRGEAEYDPLLSGPLFSAKKIASAFRSAIEDEEVKAILFRVDSPGGSYVASDTVWRETRHAKAAGKPVIVSMGDVAGSGGYFVAMAADKIVAQPGTLTGSIGVFAGKMVTTGLWNKLGVTWDAVQTSKNADFWSFTDDYTPEQWRLLQEILDRIYDDFTDKVASGRGLPLHQVQAVAKGRVWTGAAAREKGLVDELGGYRKAIELARAAADIPADQGVKLKRFPARKPLLDVLLENLPVTAGAPAAETRMLARALEAIRPALGALRELGIGGQAGVLQMPVEFDLIQ